MLKGIFLRCSRCFYAQPVAAWAICIGPPKIGLMCPTCLVILAPPHDKAPVILVNGHQAVSLAVPLPRRRDH